MHKSTLTILVNPHMHKSMLTILINPHMHMHKEKTMGLIMLIRREKYLMHKVTRVTLIRNERGLKVHCLATTS